MTMNLSISCLTDASSLIRTRRNLIIVSLLIILSNNSFALSKLPLFQNSFNNETLYLINGTLGISSWYLFSNFILLYFNEFISLRKAKKDETPYQQEAMGEALFNGL